MVLVVDDDTVNQKLLADICTAEGYDVVTADDGERAIEVFGQRKIHIVLVDATMPRMDGFAVCRQIRADGDVPVIMVTASMEPGIQNRALEAGATAFVSKPFRVYELTRHIRSALVAYRSPSEPPTSQRRFVRRQAASALTRLPGAVDLRLRLRREPESDDEERACMVVRFVNERQLSAREGRHAIDAVLGAVGESLLSALGEGAVFWSDTAELVGVMAAKQLEAAVEATRSVPGGFALLQLEGVVLRLGAVRYRPSAGHDVDTLLQSARSAVEAAAGGNEPIVIRNLDAVPATSP
ncbi:MAG: response regulator [Deltaproteobacteria bacterium]|nr:response regulator [Deltaproteobacteria bacterium]